MTDSVQTAAGQGTSVCVPIDDYQRLTADLAAARVQLSAIRDVLNRPRADDERTWDYDRNENTVTLISNILEPSDTEPGTP